MNLREALIIQSPSLELQRAAADEIARLDATVRHIAMIHYETQATLANVLVALQGAVEFSQTIEDEFAGAADFNRLLGFVEAAINCTKKEAA